MKVAPRPMIPPQPAEAPPTPSLEGDPLRKVLEHSTPRDLDQFARVSRLWRELAREAAPTVAAKRGLAGKLTPEALADQAVLAAGAGDVERLHLLLRRGAHPDGLDVDTPTISRPLHRALERERFEAVRLLLDAQCSVTRRAGSQQETALHVAAARGALELAAELLQRGADVDARDRFGNTPLFAAVQHPRMLEFLLAADAKAHLDNERGDRAREHAISLGCDESAAILADAPRPNLLERFTSAPPRLWRKTRAAVYAELARNCHLAG